MNPSQFKGPDRPAQNITWEDAQDFLAMLTYMFQGLLFWEVLETKRG